VIGPQWADIRDASGKRRLEDPKDFVRREVAAGLQRKDVRVIPVLVSGAQMPRPETLPDELKALATRQSYALRYERFTADANGLLDQLVAVVRPKGGRRPAIIALVVSALLVLLGFYFYNRGALHRDDRPAQTAVLREAPVSRMEPSASASFGSFNIDFFYCEKNRASSEPLARAAISLKGAGDTGRWRIRALPESVNQQPGYGLSSSEIRFTPPEERSVAEALSKALATKNIQAALHETSYPTPDYVSVFICQ
jgi:hypothetical protein